MRLKRVYLSTLLFLGWAALLPPLAAQSSSVSFEKHIEPIFHERCYMCHGPSQQMNGLRLDQKEAALKGGYSGPVIIPGDSSASHLIERLTSGKEGFRMPPVGEPLPDEQIAALKAWIDAGAVWPEEAAPQEPAQKAEEKPLHWSFQPVERPQPPEVDNQAWVRNPIDRFILARLESEGIQPSPEADKVTLLRRVYFDLTGLPPAPGQVDRFLADNRPEAYEEVVDELLRSPHYGEKQAIHWLDAARYADSDGYERDPQRPYAWRWRDWVIRALNDDMPFDEFTVKQIAGDLLPDATVEDRVATGFLRNGIKNREAGVKLGERRFEEVLDRINTAGTVFLGLTAGCAQCHDHKYDPLSQKEFYSMFATLNNAVERDIRAPLPGETGTLLRTYPEYRREREKVLNENGIPELLAEWREKILQAMANPGVNTDWDFQVTEWRAAHDRPDWKMKRYPEGLTELERDEVVDWFLRSPGPEIEKQEEVSERVKKTREQIEKLKQEYPQPTRAYTMIERNEPVTTHIALRGDWRAKGIAVEPDVPAVLPEMETEGKPVRLSFAEWLASDGNPLTPRVTVNRMWQELFGRGLVRTSEDFGTQGERPSHPKLLDWLAAEFLESGWSRKHMLRLMVTSAAYRQSSRARPELDQLNPGNELLARQNRLRLPAELIRDNALKVSGLLYPKAGGPSIRPPQPDGVLDLNIMYVKKRWEAETDRNRYRRGLYIFFQRTAPYPMLMNFDAPDTFVASVRRERTNTPLQALNLLNDAVFIEAAQALAYRVIQEEEDFNSRLERMFRLCLSRRPDGVEKDRIATFFARQREIFEQEPESVPKVAAMVPEGESAAGMAAWTAVARGLMNLDEFITRE